MVKIYKLFHKGVEEYHQVQFRTGGKVQSEDSCWDSADGVSSKIRALVEHKQANADDYEIHEFDRIDHFVKVVEDE